MSELTTPWLTVAEAAARLRVSRKTIYRAARQGELRVARIGGRRALRFLPEWVDAFAIAKADVVDARVRR